MANPTFLLAVAEIDAGANDIVRLIGQADTLQREGDPGLALTLYKYWLLKYPDHPLRKVPAFNIGSLCLQLGDTASARTYLARAIEADADFYPAYLNLSAAIERSGDPDGAVLLLQQMMDRLSAVNQQAVAHKVQAAKNIARIKRSAEMSENALRLAIEVDPAQSELVQHWFNRRQGRCVWPTLSAVGNLSADDVLLRMAPLTVAAYLDDPLLQLELARRYTDQMARSRGRAEVAGAWPAPIEATKPTLHIGYLSSDFCGHAVGYLMTDVFDHHDRERFRISVFNIGEVSDDPIKKGIHARVDFWADIKGMSDTAAARLIIEQGVDILIDMNGHTNYQRSGLLALKPAPIICNWLGYPGTMGSTVHHYIIADEFVIPAGYEAFYSEAVLRLPCYQPNGKLYAVPALAPTRADLGLPDDAFVFCCFNGSVKITEPVFSRWMEILRAVPNSVLWLRGSPTDEFANSLRTEALRRGVAAERLVFLPFRSNTEYLACHVHADLFLDTFPYGAHTTASDALRMGVPIVTLAGLSFASRVCGSLSHAAGLDALICTTPRDYVATAIRIGNDPEACHALKRTLAEALPGCTLFDSAKLVRHLEQQFENAWQAYAAGNLPRSKPRLSLESPVMPAIPAGDNDVASLPEYWRRVERLSSSLCSAPSHSD